MSGNHAPEPGTQAGGAGLRADNAPLVAFDLTVGRLDAAGTGTHVTCLSAELRRLLSDLFVALDSAGARTLPPRGCVHWRLETLLRDLGWFQFGAVRAARRVGARLLHLPATVGPVRTTFPVVLTIHDVAPLRYPQYFKPWFRAYGRAVIPRAARAARHIITVSQASKADIVNLLGIAPEFVTVIPNGVDLGALRQSGSVRRGAENVRARYGLPESFALTVCSIEPRKNLPRLLRAVAQLRARPETRDMMLVHVGPIGWMADNVWETLAHLRLDGAVRFLGRIPLAHLGDLYASARLMVYPSLFEGFGLPILEAMAAGCPVVTSDRSSMPEVAGDAALYLDPTDEDSIAQSLARVWLDDGLRGELVKRGRIRAAAFTWSRTASETIRVYQQCLQG